MDPMVPFPPVVEPDLPGAFITKHPRETVAENSKTVPFLTGITYDEGAMKSAREKNLLSHCWNSYVTYICFSTNLAYLNIPGLFDDFANHIDRALPIILYYDHHNLSTQHSITSKIKEFYFNNDVRREKETNLTNVGWPLTNLSFANTNNER